MHENPITRSLQEKIQEQIDRTLHLIDRLPPGGGEWWPDESPAFTTAELLGHLLECFAGVSAVLHKCEPQRLAHFMAVRQDPVGHAGDAREARRRIDEYARLIDEGFALLTDDRLAETLPTVFVPAGETVATLLLGNLEHVINHKYQLFSYLKRMGVPVGTADLYRFRGDLGGGR